MRRFFSRSRAPSPSALAEALTSTTYADRETAVRQAAQLGANELADDTLQQALIGATQNPRNKGLLPALLPLVANAERLCALVEGDEELARAWLQARPDRSSWPGALRASDQLLLLMLRAQLTAARDPAAALTLLRSEDVERLAVADQLDLWLSRRDLEAELLARPAFTTDDGLQLLEHRSRTRNKRINRAARAQIKERKAARTSALHVRKRRQELIDAVQRLNHQVELAGVLTVRDEQAHAALQEQWQTLDGDPEDLPALIDSMPHESTRAEPDTAPDAEPVAAAAVDDEQEPETADDPIQTAETTAEPVLEPEPAEPVDRSADLARWEQYLTAAERHLEAGETRAAGAALGAARKLDDPALPLGQTERRRLARVQNQLRDLGRWETYATSPKRDELLTSIREAADAPLDPEPQAERIKELRRAWRELGPPRGAAERDQAKAFDEAAERAFEPCRAFFAERSAEREANAEARRALCNMIERYLAETDWASADFPAAERILKRARADWNRYRPVPRKGEQALRKRFEGLQAELYDRINAHWDTHRAAKQALVSEAEALANGTAPLAERIEQAKTLQGRWQTAGRIPRKEDQALWQAFRAHLDRLFGAREQERRAVDEARADQRAEIDRAIEALEASQETPTQAALSDCLATVHPLIDALPHRDRRIAEQRLRTAETSYRQALRAERAAQRLAAIDALLTQDALATTNPADLAADAPAALRNERCALDAAALNEWVLRLEIRADVESPAAAQEQRMALKLAKLQSRGQADDLDSLDALALAEAWCAFGAKADHPEVSALRERFRRVLHAIA